MINKKIVFVILIYGNYKDLQKFVNSLSLDLNREDVALIVVNSFKDKETTTFGEEYCQKIHADFLTIPNKGYGYGNNQGVSFALKKYSFQYLVVANPDVEISEINLNDIHDNEILGPKVITDNGKNQNPYYYIRPKLGYFFLKKYVISNNKLPLYVYLVINKLTRKIFDLISLIQKKRSVSVYALHGSLLAMNRDTLKKIVPLFNENMFLFAEENHLAKLAQSKQIKMIYKPSWIIKHHEDGSGMTNRKIIEKYTKESLNVFFKEWE